MVVWRSGIGPNPRLIEVHGMHLYVTTEGGARQQGAILRVPKVRGKHTVLARRQGKPCALALDKKRVYWADCKSGTIWRVRMTGGSPQRLARRQMRVRALVVAGKRLIWLVGSTSNRRGYRQDGKVVSLQLPRGKASVIARRQWNPLSAVIAGRRLYWVSCCENTPSGDRGQINRIPLAGGRVNSIVRRETTPFGIAVAGKFIYYSIGQFLMGQIRRLRR